MSLKTTLKKAGANWKNARKRAETDSFDEFPDGRYLLRLKSAQVGESQASGRAQVAWGFVIKDGEYEGKTIRDYTGLETEDNLVYLVRRLGRFGYEAPDDLADLQDVLDEIVKEKPLCRGRLISKGEYQNLRIDKVMNSGDDSEEESEEAEETEETEETEESETAEEEEEAEEESEETEEEEEETEEEEAEEESEEGEVALEVGMKVIVTIGSKEVEGVVTKISEEGDKVTVKCKDKKIRTVPVENVAVVAEEEKEEEPEEVPDEPVKPPKSSKGKVNKVAGKKVVKKKGKR